MGILHLYYHNGEYKNNACVAQIFHHYLWRAKFGRHVWRLTVWCLTCC